MFYAHLAIEDRDRMEIWWVDDILTTDGAVRWFFTVDKLLVMFDPGMPTRVGMELHPGPPFFSMIQKIAPLKKGEQCHGQNIKGMIFP